MSPVHATFQALDVMRRRGRASRGAYSTPGGFVGPRLPMFHAACGAMPPPGGWKILDLLTASRVHDEPLVSCPACAVLVDEAREVGAGGAL